MTKPAKKETDGDTNNLIEMLGDARKFTIKLKKEFDALPMEAQVLMVEMEDHLTINIELLRYLLSRFNRGIYITVNQPIHSFIPKLEGEKIDHKRLYFIDGITKKSAGKELEGDAYYYIETPRDLVDLIFDLEKIVKKIDLEKEKVFVVLDSITTLLIYNDQRVIEKFAHNMVGRMRSWKMASIMLTSAQTGGEIATFLEQFCDKKITI